jgi:hypothetical protein
MKRVCFGVLLSLASFACHRAPDEPVTPRDAEAPGSSARMEGEAAAGSPSLASGGGPGTPASGDGGGSPARDFCFDAFGADNERLKGVCSAEDLSFNQGMERGAAKACASDFASALARGRATFDADAARSCVEMLRSKAMVPSSEGDTLFAHAPCDRVLLGTQTEGAVCRFSVECKEGLACVGYRAGADGTCKKPPRAGEACSGQAYATILNALAAAPHHPPCARGAWCDGTTCRPRTPAGKTCTSSDVCEEGLACTMGTCGVPAPKGARCSTSRDCAYGLWCDRGAEGGAGKCAAKRDEGQPCSANDDCKGRCEMPKGDAGGAEAGKCVPVCGSG